MEILNNVSLEKLKIILAKSSKRINSTGIIVPANQEIATQNHHDQEIWYIISGTGIVKSEKNNKVVQSGEVVIFAPFEHHAMFNNGPAELRFTAFWYCDWEKIDEAICKFNANLIKHNASSLIVMHDKRQVTPVTKLFFSICQATEKSIISYERLGQNNNEINEIITKLIYKGCVFTKEIQYPYSLQTKKFIDIEEIAGKCFSCNTIINNITCFSCGNLHTEFQLLQPFHIKTGEILSILPATLLYLKINNAELKQIDFLYGQTDDYSSIERVLLNKYSSSAELEVPITAFSQSGKTIKLPKLTSQKIIPEMYRALTSAYFYSKKPVNEAGILFANLENFYIYSIVFQQILLLETPNRPLPRVVLDHQYIYKKQIIKITRKLIGDNEVEFLIGILTKLNNYLHNYSFYVPEPGQWSSKDILFISDIRTSIKRFFYYTQCDTFNVSELNLIRTQIASAISEYLIYMTNIESTLDERHHRTKLSLSIYAVKWLLWITNIFMSGALNLNKLTFNCKDLITIEYGSKLNLNNLIKDLGKYMQINSRLGEIYER